MENEKGAVKYTAPFSFLVPPALQFLNQFQEDLKKLYELKPLFEKLAA
jgi:hypothetical protein